MQSFTKRCCLRIGLLAKISEELCICQFLEYCVILYGFGLHRSCDLLPSVVTDLLYDVKLLLSPVEFLFIIIVVQTISYICSYPSILLLEPQMHVYAAAPIFGF